MTPTLESRTRTGTPARGISAFIPSPSPLPLHNHHMPTLELYLPLPRPAHREVGPNALIQTDAMAGAPRYARAPAPSGAFSLRAKPLSYVCCRTDTQASCAHYMVDNMKQFLEMTWRE